MAKKDSKYEPLCNAIYQALETAKNTELPTDEDTGLPRKDIDIDQFQKDILCQLAIDLTGAIYDFVTKGEIRGVQTEIAKLFLFSVRLKSPNMNALRSEFLKYGIILREPILSEPEPGKQWEIRDKLRTYLLIKQEEEVDIIDVYMSEHSGETIGSGKQSNVVTIIYSPPPPIN